MTNYKCDKCNNLLPETQYLPTHSPFFPSGHSTICIKCLVVQLKGDDLHSLDKLCQWLDYPFAPDEWMTLYQTNGMDALMVYGQLMMKDVYHEIDWTDVNKQWHAILEEEREVEKLASLSKGKIKKLTKTWGSGYSIEEMEYMQRLLEDMIYTQDLSLGTTKDIAKKVCRLALVADRQIKEGTGFKDTISSYNALIKSAGFSTKNATSSGDFESIGELVMFLVKKGWNPKFYNGESQDVVDETIVNIQGYIRSLIDNEPGIKEQVKERIDLKNKIERLDVELSNQEVEKYDAGVNSTEDIEFDDDGILDE
jgi:hypothetical protein